MLLSPVVLAAVLESTTTPHPGITHDVYVDAAIPARIHVIEVDLSSLEIHLLATEEGQRGGTPCEFSTTSGAQVVINGDYFSPIGFRPAGLAMGGSSLWADTEDDDLEGFLRFDRNADLNGASISVPEDVVGDMEIPIGTLGIVGGRPMIVRAGIQQTSFDCTDVIALACERAPRTAVALSVDSNTLWLAIVDGWQAASIGMTAAELGALLESLGAHNALLLDGGASSALCVDGALVNSPSDGIERPVANHLGVRFGSLPPGELLGQVRECNIFTGPDLEGVLVVLDDGQSQTTGADGRYSFPNMTPRFACVTASKAGYIEKTQCRQVMSGVITFNSIDLAPDSGCPMPDAGPTPDADPTPDAEPGAPDANPSIGPDAGDSGTDPGCGCSVPTRKRGSRLPILAVCALALVLIRSRRRS